MATIPDDGQKKVTAATPRRRRRSGIRVRMLMVLVLVLGCWLGWYVPRVRVQQAAVAAIKDAGGSVSYDWEWDYTKPEIINHHGELRAPEWLARLVGVDYVANVDGVMLGPHGSFVPDKANDATLAHVGRLRSTKTLWLRGTTFTDAGLAHLKDLTSLEQLDLWQTQIGGAGLTQLKGLNRLRIVRVHGTGITDVAALELEKARPGVYIIREEEMPDPALVRRAIADLDFARSQPGRLACALLAHRTRSMAKQNDAKEFSATVDALCDLEATDTWSLIKKAEALSQCLGQLRPRHAPTMPESQRQALERRCADSGVAALARAVALGYDNVRRLDGNIEHMRGLWNLHDHPGFSKLIETMTAKDPGR